MLQLKLPSQLQLGIYKVSFSVISVCEFDYLLVSSSRHGSHNQQLLPGQTGVRTRVRVPLAGQQPATDLCDQKHPLHQLTITPGMLILFCFDYPPGVSQAKSMTT